MAPKFPKMPMTANDGGQQADEGDDSDEGYEDHQAYEGDDSDEGYEDQQAYERDDSDEGYEDQQAYEGDDSDEGHEDQQAYEGHEDQQAYEGDDSDKGHEDQQAYEGDDSDEAMKDQSTQCGNGPVNRPNWAMHGLTSTDPEGEEFFEVQTLEEGRWVCSTGMSKDTRLDEMVQECQSPGCGSYRASYRALGIAVSVERARFKKKLRKWYNLTDEAKKLSPKTAERVQAVATLGPDVTKTTLAEHEKALSSAEASVMKALQLLNKLSAELEAQREKDAAKEFRANEIRARRTKEMEKVRKAARQQGKHEADQAWSSLVDWSNHLSHRVNWHVEEWSGSGWKLAGCRTDATLAQAVECPGVLPESKELLQKQWDACKPLWFSHPVDELADRLNGVLANQPDKAVSNQGCIQRKVPLQAQDAPLFLHELFPEIGPLAEDLFAGEERLALAFLRLHKQDVDVLRGYMQLRRMDAGPLWSSVSVDDMKFGRFFMYVCSGRMFVAMLPFDVFDKAVLEEGETLGQVFLTFQCNWRYMFNDDGANAAEDGKSSFSMKLSYLSIIMLPQGLFRSEPELQLARRRMALCRDSAKTPDQVKFRQMGDAGLELVGYLLPAIELEVKQEADAKLWDQLETQQRGLPPKVRIDYDDVPVDLHGFLAQDEADVEYELGRAKAHPYFEAHISYIKTELGVEDDYQFGSDDCIADLEFWFEWLQGKKEKDATKALAQLKKMQESSRKRAEEAAAAEGRPKATAKHPKSPKAKTPNPKAKSNQLKGKSKPGNK
eukprot:s105_g4.t1